MLFKATLSKCRSVKPQGLVTIHVNILSMYKHIQGRTSFFTPATFTLGPCCSLLRRIPDKNDRCAFTRGSRGGVMIFFEKNKVLGVAGNNRRNNKLKKMDSNQEKALKMAFIIHCMYKSKMFSFHFKSSRSFNDV
jgi:hypothetical protein